MFVNTCKLHSNYVRMCFKYILYSRFAEFMETSAHVSTETVEEYEKDIENYDSNSDSSNLSDDIKELEYTSDSE